MMVLGGNLRSGVDILNNVTCNTSWPTLRMLDTTTFEWQTTFNPTASAYAVPDQVYSIIGGRSVRTAISTVAITRC